MRDNLETRILLGHGSGGKLTSELVRDVFWPSFGNEGLLQGEDAGRVGPLSGRLAFTTDAFVVSPWKFKGGDIGKLAVFGTCNDLAMLGAEPKAITLSFILEEGFLMRDLKEIAESVGKAAHDAKVSVVAGDTKVVERGKADGIFISSSAIGVIADNINWSPSQIQVGDAVIVSGDIGRHGATILAAREGFKLSGDLSSDCMSLWPLVHELVAEGVRVRALRDATRGGLATVLHELASASKKSIEVIEKKVPVSSAVAAACELFGLDPLYLANEGRFVAVVDAEDTDRALMALRRYGDAVEVGKVIERRSFPFLVRGLLGNQRVLEPLTTDPLPRIC